MRRRGEVNIYEAIAEGFLELIAAQHPVVDRERAVRPDGASLTVIVRHETVFAAVQLLINQDGILVVDLGVADRFRFSQANYRTERLESNVLLRRHALEDPGLEEAVLVSAGKGLNP